MMRTGSTGRPLLRLFGIGKSFGPVRVLDDVSFELRAGEVHLLAGENGAGKSTLIKILGGVHTEYDGAIELDGARVRFASPTEANRYGISVFHQELSLVGTMSVADNILLGREPARGAGWWLDRRAAQTQALELCRRLDLDFSSADLARPVDEFPMSVKNRIEIAKALSFDAKILVMDEPTSALNAREVERLFVLLETLKQQGCGIIYISHKMDEIYRVADRITVLRNGRHVGTAPAKDCPESQLLYWMIGRGLAELIPVRAMPLARTGSPPRFAVRALRVPHRDASRPPVVNNFSVSVQPGEIVGLAGLQGAGCSEVLHALFGSTADTVSGDVHLDGVRFVPRNPRASIARGVALLTADRRGAGLVPGLSVATNISLAVLPRVSGGGWLRAAEERARAQARVETLGVKLASIDQPVATLSGGNQQKVVLAKWLETEPGVLLLDEPTRGVDVGAKHEIYALMRQWSVVGMAMLFTSTEMPELLGLADRIIVLHRGETTAVFERGDATPEKILAAAMGRVAA